MIYYFTGSGNSLWIARTLAKELNDSVSNIANFQSAPLSCGDNIIGFVFPTYMGDLPWLVKKLLLSAKLNPESYIFLVMDSNNGESGNAFASMDAALCSIGCQLSAGFNIQMPGNCLVSSETENQERLAAAPEKVEEISRKIEHKCRNYQFQSRKAEKGFVENSYFYGMHSLKRLTLMKGFRVNNSCNGCGICASVCPTHNIQIKNGKAVHGNNCAACYACLHWCPKYATHLTVPMLKNRPQYHHPQISLKDMKQEGEN